jgi:hypothetical protein
MKPYPRSASVAWLYAFGILVLLGGCTTLKQKQARLLHATSFGMEQIAPRVYVSKEVSDVQRKQLLSSIETARHRVTEFYGGLVSDPTIYGCATRECIEFFGGMGDGYAVQMTGILLSPKSFIPEPIAHEWSHVELFARLDGKFMGMPGWFNEGLAVVVSELPQHSEAVYQEAVSSGYPIPSMSDLAGRQWTPAFMREYENPKGLNIVYSTVGHEVRVWYQRVGQAGLLDLIDALKAGEQFSDTYP